MRAQSHFDHEALLDLKAAAALSSSQGYALRLLDVSRCQNATPSGLSAALERLQQLLYLDISGTYAAKDRQVLSKLSRLSNLVILKARSLSLNDDDFALIARGIQGRVQSLDLRQNRLTDTSAQSLVDYCFPAVTSDHNAEAAFERARVLRSVGPAMLSAYQGGGFDGVVRHSITSGFARHFVFEDISPGGVTHLYIAQNNVGPDGVSLLLRNPLLRVLDAGRQARPPTSKLAQALLRHRTSNLTSLRLDHQIVTAKQQRWDLLPEDTRAGRIGSTLAVPSTANAPRSHSSVRNAREARLTSLDGSFYHPAMTRTLRTLTLTAFPSHSKDSTTVDNMIHFLRACASESHLAAQQALLDWSLPPASHRSTQHRKSLERDLFALSTIVLEVVSPFQQQVDQSRAAVSDADAENMWREAEGDFSFFDEGVGDSDPVIQRRESVAESQFKVDNIAALAAWRGARKAAHERAKVNAAPDEIVEVEGYWPGTIRVVRINGREDDGYADEALDYLRPSR